MFHKQHHSNNLMTNYRISDNYILHKDEKQYSQIYLQKKKSEITTKFINLFISLLCVAFCLLNRRLDVREQSVHEICLIVIQ